MAEKIDRVGNDIISYYLQRQIDVLDKIQTKAADDGNIKAVCEISDKILKAVKQLDMHESSEKNKEENAFDKVLRGRCESVRPPSNKLLQTAVEIYDMKAIDGLSGDSIIKKIWQTECRLWGGL